MKPYPGLAQLQSAMPGASIDEVVRTATKQPPPNYTQNLTLPATRPVTAVITLVGDASDVEALLRQLADLAHARQVEHAATEQQRLQTGPCRGCGHAE